MGLDSLHGHYVIKGVDKEPLWGVVRKIPGVNSMAPPRMAQTAHPSLRPDSTSVQFQPGQSLLPLSACLPGSSLPPALFFAFFRYAALAFFSFAFIHPHPVRLRFRPSCFRTLPKHAAKTPPFSPYASWVECQQPPAQHSHVM